MSDVIQIRANNTATWETIDLYLECEIEDVLSKYVVSSFNGPVLQAAMTKRWCGLSKASIKCTQGKKEGQKL